MPRNAVGHRKTSKHADEALRRGYPGFVLLEQVGSLRVFVKSNSIRPGELYAQHFSGYRDIEVSDQFQVINRKVTNRFRAQWAAEADVAVRTVIDTASLVGTNLFTQIRQTLSS